MTLKVTKPSQPFGSGMPPVSDMGRSPSMKALAGMDLADQQNALAPKDVTKSPSTRGKQSEPPKPDVTKAEPTKADATPDAEHDQKADAKSDDASPTTTNDTTKDAAKDDTTPDRPALDAPVTKPTDAKPSDANANATPNTPQQAPKSEAAKMRAAIGGADAVFDGERGQYDESYMAKHDRHQRNKELKKNIKADGHKGDDLKARYENQREHTPDSERRTRNKNLKVGVKDSAKQQADAEAKAKGLTPEQTEKRYQELKLQAYMYEREYAGGDAKRDKARKKIDMKLKDQQTELANAELRARLEKNAGSKGPSYDLEADFQAKRTKTEKEKIKDAKKQKEAAKVSRWERMNPLADDTTKQKVADHDAKEKVRKDEKKTKKAEDKAYVADLEKQVAAKTISWEQAGVLAQTRGFATDSVRTDWNKKLKGKVGHADYRKSKIHVAGPAKEGEEPGKKIKTVVDLVDKTTTAAGGGNTLAKGIASGLGDTNVTGTKEVADNGQTFKMGGTANESAAIIGAVSSFTGAIGDVDKIGTALSRRNDEDAAVRNMAKDDVAQGVISLASDLTSGTGSILKAVQAFTADPAVAQAMALQGVPIVGIIGASIKLITACVSLASSGERVYKSSGLRQEAKDKGASPLAAAFKSARAADVQLMTTSTIDVITSLSAIVGHGLTLGGVTGPAGLALTSAAAGVSAVKSLAVTVYEDIEARQAKKAQVKYAQAVKGGNEDEIADRGKKLITTNVKYAMQIIASAAREGDPTALSYLQMFGLDTANFATMKDENLRAAMLQAVEKDEEPQTIVDKILEVPSKLRDAKRSAAKELHLRKYS